jgi:hypothetical protein
MTSTVELLDRIDDYADTVFAILGFVNFYRFDDQTRQIRDGVLVFQGRRLTPSPAKATTPEGNTVDFVTPDFGVLYQRGYGVLGDAKKSFPKDQAFWMDDFKQLMAYDDDLSGWPSPNGGVQQHDVVLLTHQSRAVALCDYCQEQLAAGQISFDRPLAIISFNRSDERQPYFHFEKRLGRLSEKVLDDRLRQGVSVPMSVRVAVYSTIKLYDSEPPLPYMAQLIWEHVVTPRASDDPEFPTRHKNQKVEVALTVDEIVDELHRGFSFHVLCPDDRERQPHVPRKEWCMRACEALVTGGAAKWSDARSKEVIIVYFRKVESVLEYMLGVCKGEGGEPEGQLSLFSDEQGQPSGRSGEQDRPSG